MRFTLATTFALAVGFIALTPQFAYAYLGPGAGLSAIGAILAVVAGLLIAIFGFIWYPVKRMRRKRRERAQLRQNAAGASDPTSK